MNIKTQSNVLIIFYTIGFIQFIILFITGYEFKMFLSAIFCMIFAIINQIQLSENKINSIILAKKITKKVETEYTLKKVE